MPKLLLAKIIFFLSDFRGSPKKVPSYNINVLCPGFILSILTKLMILSPISQALARQTKIWNFSDDLALQQNFRRWGAEGYTYKKSLNDAFWEGSSKII